MGTYAVQYTGDNAWSIPRLYCNCRPDGITTATLGVTRLLATGWLATTMDTAIQQTMRTLTSVKLVATSYPETEDG